MRSTVTLQRRNLDENPVSGLRRVKGRVDSKIGATVLLVRQPD